MTEKTQPTDAEIDELWRFEASKNWDSTLAMRTSFAALVAAKEREACAQVCEGFKQGNSATYIDDDWADMCAAAIRARGKP